MKSLIVFCAILVLLASVTLVIDNAADISPGHDDQTDISNAMSELKRFKLSAVCTHLV